MAEEAASPAAPAAAPAPAAASPAATATSASAPATTTTPSTSATRTTAPTTEGRLPLREVAEKRERNAVRLLRGLSPLAPVLMRFPHLAGATAEEQSRREAPDDDGRARRAGAAARDAAAAADRTCPQCGNASNNNRVYCYACLVPVRGVALPPRVRLPVKLDVVRHPSEKRAKSTALHAQVLCGAEDVRTVEMDAVASLGALDPASTVLLFPSRSSVTLDELPNLRHVKRVVVVDSTWGSTGAVLRLPQLQGLPHVRLKDSNKTSFWRYQLKGEDHLATIEAIYFFYREWFEAAERTEYDGRFDDLLHIFAAMLEVIQAHKAGASGEGGAGEEGAPPAKRAKE